MASAKSFFSEAVQFVPVITLASSFIVAGGVELERAAPLFVISASVAVVITGLLLAKRVRLNPILLGTNVWLVVGAIGFGVPVDALSNILGQIQAAGLFIATLLVGIVLTLFKPDTGFIGMPHPNLDKIRKLSLILIVLTVGVLIWSFVFVDNIRLGGALPFIVLNVTRRVLMRRNAVTD